MIETQSLFSITKLFDKATALNSDMYNTILAPKSTSNIMDSTKTYLF